MAPHIGPLEVLHPVSDARDVAKLRIDIADDEAAPIRSKLDVGDGLDDLASGSCLSRGVPAIGLPIHHINMREPAALAFAKGY